MAEFTIFFQKTKAAVPIKAILDRNQVASLPISSVVPSYNRAVA
ncbi:MAG TPA: hypothetical protein VK133_03155 [Amoebophilaceae bacterium]|nr:hypothetical protein [Amoebophilaceae bacterium]